MGSDAKSSASAHRFNVHTINPARMLQFTGNSFSKTVRMGPAAVSAVHCHLLLGVLQSKTNINKTAIYLHVK